MKRRTFLKLAGLGSISFLGCTPDTDKKLFALLHAPEDGVTGNAQWYATTCRECPAGCGMLAKNREGRIVKLEGNPLHPVNKGTLCARGQAALQGLYHPDRLKTPMVRAGNGWQPLSFNDARILIAEKMKAASEKGTDRVRMMTETVGQDLSSLFAETMARYRSPEPVVFEPYAYESLKRANDAVFGINGLGSYKIEEADLLLSFGADFLDTWLSPVAHAAQFKQMHAPQNGKKGFFFHIAPYRSLTGANADRWISCNPGSEAVIALGLINEMVRQKKSPAHSRAVLDKMEKISSPYRREIVIRLSGITPDDYASLVFRVTAAKKPLILPTGAATPGHYTLQADMAVNLLNYLLDPQLAGVDFSRCHRVQAAASRGEVYEFFDQLEKTLPDVLLINNTNPVFALAGDPYVTQTLRRDSLFTICFSNIMDETAREADLVFPVKHFLETWDEYSGMTDMVSFNQPTMGSLTAAPAMGDVFFGLLPDTQDRDMAVDRKTGEKGKSAMPGHMADRLAKKGLIKNPEDWVKALQTGGIFNLSDQKKTPAITVAASEAWEKPLVDMAYFAPADTVFAAVPSLRFYDGRSGNRAWLCEIPDPLTKIAWQTPLLVHPETARSYGVRQHDVVSVGKRGQTIQAAVYETIDVRRGVLAMSIGQGHTACGRYAENTGTNPLRLLDARPDTVTGGGRFDLDAPVVRPLGKTTAFAHTDGERTTLDRKIALSQRVHGKDAMGHGEAHGTEGLAMDAFPLTLPLPEGYDKKRDFYPPHDHTGYRWAMVIDLDRCIGCGACAAACYAENNLPVMGKAQIQKGREMAWMSVERYDDPNKDGHLIFMPMLCQHCDNAPCESVCPVYAPHHSNEGLNNQVYNRCIGTRFCSQNCPYKVRRFNWLDSNWHDMEKLQLNPDVTVRSKGVMEKCSFCVQRIKAAHGIAKDEKRNIQDGEVIPACVQTCPTTALVFGNLMDPDSQVSKLVKSPRAYQAMGYLNTKPAVIYLKKQVWEI